MIFVVFSVALRRFAPRNFAHTSSYTVGRTLELACHLNVNLLIRTHTKTRWRKLKQTKATSPSQFALPSALVCVFYKILLFFTQFCSLFAICHFRLEETFSKFWWRYHKSLWGTSDILDEDWNNNSYWRWNAKVSYPLEVRFCLCFYYTYCCSELYLYFYSIIESPVVIS